MRPFRAAMASGRGAAAGTDPFHSNVVLQLNMTGAAGSTSFPDTSPFARTMTAAGNAQVSTALGYNTAIFDGSDDRITTPYVKADFDWWTGDYTIDAWIYVSSLTGWQYVDGVDTPTLIGCADPASATNYWSFGLRSSGALAFAYYNGSAQRAFALNVPTGVLSHIAVIKSSGGIRFASANSTTGATVTSNTAISGTPQSSTSGVVLTIGQINNTCINGHIKALRITRADRGYANGYTPPPAPFPTS